MKHWTEKFFKSKPELWLHLMNQGWKSAGVAVRAIVKILKKHAIHKGRLLELACGNGRICINMAKKGFEVTGVDISPLYIEDAIRKAKKHGVKAKFICGDIRHIGKIVKGKFDVIITIWTSIGFYNKKTDQSIFRQAAELIKPNGLFLILNTMSQEYLLSHYCERLYNDTDKFILLHKGAKFNRFHSINKEKWVFYEKEGKDLKYVDELDLTLRIYSIHEIIEMAEKACFEFIEAYHSLRTLESARPDSVINLVFKKPA